MLTTAPLARVLFVGLLALPPMGVALANESGDADDDKRIEQAQEEPATKQENQESEQENAKPKDSDESDQDDVTGQEADNRSLDFESGSDAMMEPGV